ncbi:hypothetical protein MKX03_010983 [Papaver bracteatum]|nr:hypothetical protein MKX03_010983 [Papaver bracteatum]
MSAPLRVLQIRRLGKFTSARNFSSEVEGAKEVSDKDVYKKAGAQIAKFSAAGFVGMTFATWLQYKAYGHATSILGFSFGKKPERW